MLDDTEESPHFDWFTSNFWAGHLKAAKHQSVVHGSAPDSTAL
jgi:hypothetical protein